MKTAIVGFGSIGQRHYKNLSGLAKNIVVFSKRTDVVLPFHVRSWRDFYKNGPYDGIIIANETSKHISALKKCMRMTKNIFMEKPLSNNASGLNDVASGLKRKKINIWVGYNWHFSKTLLKIKSILRQKKLGRVYYMRVSVGQDLRGWRPGRDYSKIYSAKKKLGGGVILDLVHDINYPAWLLDDVLIPQISYVRKISNLKIDTEDFAESVFIGKKTGAIVSVHQDYLRTQGKRSLEIAGSKGSLVWDSLSQEIVLETPKKTTKARVPEERNKMYEKEIKFFLDQIRRGKRFSNISEAIRDIKNIEWLKKYGR